MFCFQYNRFLIVEEETQSSMQYFIELEVKREKAWNSVWMYMCMSVTLRVRQREAMGFQKNNFI